MCQTLTLIFVFYKKVISPNVCNFLILANVFFESGCMSCGCAGAFLGKEGGIQVFSGIGPFSSAALYCLFTRIRQRAAQA